MTNTPGSPHNRVEEALDQHRLRLKMSWRAVAQKAGISPETLRKIRIHGTSGVNPVNIAAVEEALRMGQGSIHAIQEGRVTVPETPSVGHAGQDGDGLSLVDAPGGGKAWRLVRAIDGEEMEFTTTAREGITRDVAMRELKRIADGMEVELLLHQKRRMQAHSGESRRTGGGAGFR